MIGTSIGNFIITEHIGKGGMGEVWLAEHKEIKTRVAIKVLLPTVSADRQHVQRFFNEAVAVSKIKHAGIAKIFDVGYGEHGQAYLIMEFLDGETLSARVRKRGRLSLTQLLDVATQIASVLEATHAEGITHRDLKPDNIFLVRDRELASGERVKILDFGIAKLDTLGANNTPNTISMGTPSYMSPEQWNAAGTADGRADVYSFGCVLFELACGRPPFIASSIGEMCTMHLNVPPPGTRSIIPSLPVEFDALVDRMLAKAAGARPSIEEIQATLAGLGATSLDETLPAEPSVPKHVRAEPSVPKHVAPDALTAVSRGPAPILPKRSKRGPWLVGGGLLAAAVATGIVVNSREATSAPCGSPSADNVEEVFAAATCFEQRHASGRAIAAYRQIADAHATSPRAATAELALGRLYRATGRFSEAAEALERHARRVSEPSALGSLLEAIGLRRGLGDDALAIADADLVAK